MWHVCVFIYFSAILTLSQPLEVESWKGAKEACDSQQAWSLARHPIVHEIESAIRASDSWRSHTYDTARQDHYRAT